MGAAIKICGLSDESAVRAVIKAGAEFAGFVHYPKSPRHVSVEQAAELRALLPQSIKAVAVLVNPDDELLTELATKMKPDYFQFHGDETAQRLVEVKRKFPQIGIIKAISVSNSADVASARGFYDIADFVLFDAKPEAGSQMRGGMGVAFDWRLLPKTDRNWFLSGGLNPRNVRDAIAQTGAKFIDVSSGVESKVGLKDSTLIEYFINMVRSS